MMGARQGGDRLVRAWVVRHGWQARQGMVWHGRRGKVGPGEFRLAGEAGRAGRGWVR